MWKDKFEIKIDAHPEDGMQTIELRYDERFWYIEGLEINLVFPKDDNVLAQIAEICETIINHEDNPLNNYESRKNKG